MKVILRPFLFLKNYFLKIIENNKLEKEEWHKLVESQRLARLKIHSEE